MDFTNIQRYINAKRTRKKNELWVGCRLEYEHSKTDQRYAWRTEAHRRYGSDCLRPHTLQTKELMGWRPDEPIPFQLWKIRDKSEILKQIESQETYSWEYITLEGFTIASVLEYIIKDRCHEALEILCDMAKKHDKVRKALIRPMFGAVERDHYDIDNEANPEWDSYKDYYFTETEYPTPIELAFEMGNTIAFDMLLSVQKDQFKWTDQMHATAKNLKPGNKLAYFYGINHVTEFIPDYVNKVLSSNLVRGMDTIKALARVYRDFMGISVEYKTNHVGVGPIQNNRRVQRFQCRRDFGDFFGRGNGLLTTNSESMRDFVRAIKTAPPQDRDNPQWVENIETFCGIYYDDLSFLLETSDLDPSHAVKVALDAIQDEKKQKEEAPKQFYDLYNVWKETPDGKFFDLVKYWVENLKNIFEDVRIEHVEGGYKNIKNKKDFKKMCINIPPLYKYRAGVLRNLDEKANQYLLVYKNNKPAAYLAYKLHRAGTLDEEEEPVTIDHYYIAWEASNPKGNSAVNRALKLCVLAKAIDDNVKSVALDLCGGHFFGHPSARNINLDFGFRYEDPRQTSASLRTIINKNLTEDWGVLTDDIQDKISKTCHSSYTVKMARKVLKTRKYNLKTFTKKVTAPKGTIEEMERNRDLYVLVRNKCTFDQFDDPNEGCVMILPLKRRKEEQIQQLVHMCQYVQDYETKYYIKKEKAHGSDLGSPNIGTSGRVKVSSIGSKLHRKSRSKKVSRTLEQYKPTDFSKDSLLDFAEETDWLTDDIKNEELHIYGIPKRVSKGDFFPDPGASGSLKPFDVVVAERENTHYVGKVAGYDDEVGTYRIQWSDGSRSNFHWRRDQLHTVGEYALAGREYKTGVPPYEQTVLVLPPKQKVIARHEGHYYQATIIHSIEFPEAQGIKWYVLKWANGDMTSQDANHLWQMHNTSNPRKIWRLDDFEALQDVHWGKSPKRVNPKEKPPPELKKYVSLEDKPVGKRKRKVIDLSYLQPSGYEKRQRFGTKSIKSQNPLEKRQRFGTKSTKTALEKIPSEDFQELAQRFGTKSLKSPLKKKGKVSQPVSSEDPVKWDQNPLLLDALVKGQKVVAKHDGKFCYGVISRRILPTKQTPKKKKFVKYEIDWVTGGRGEGYHRNSRGIKGKLHVYTEQEFEKSPHWSQASSKSEDSSSGTEDSSSVDYSDWSSSHVSDEPAGGASSDLGRARYLNAGDKVIAKRRGHSTCGTVHRRSMQHGRFQVRWDGTGELSEGTYHNDHKKVDKEFAYSRAQFLSKYGAQALAEVDSGRRTSVKISGSMAARKRSNI